MRTRTTSLNAGQSSGYRAGLTGTLLVARPLGSAAIVGIIGIILPIGSG